MDFFDNCFTWFWKAEGNTKGPNEHRNTERRSKLENMEHKHGSLIWQATWGTKEGTTYFLVTTMATLYLMQLNKNNGKTVEKTRLRCWQIPYCSIWPTIPDPWHVLEQFQQWLISGIWISALFFFQIYFILKSFLWSNSFFSIENFKCEAALLC